MKTYSNDKTPICCCQLKGQTWEASKFPFTLYKFSSTHLEVETFIIKILELETFRDTRALVRTQEERTDRNRSV